MDNLWTLKIWKLWQQPNKWSLQTCFITILFNGFLCILTGFFPKQAICVEETGGRKQLSAWMMEKRLCWHCQHLPILFPSDWDFPETEHPHAAEKQLLYPGSSCSNLKRIMTLARMLKIKWHKPWCCCSCLLYLHPGPGMIFFLTSSFLFHWQSYVYNWTQASL